MTWQSVTRQGGYAGLRRDRAPVKWHVRINLKLIIFERKSVDVIWRVNLVGDGTHFDGNILLEHLLHHLWVLRDGETVSDASRVEEDCIDQIQIDMSPFPVWKTHNNEDTSALQLHAKYEDAFTNLFLRRGSKKASQHPAATEAAASRGSTSTSDLHPRNSQGHSREDHVGTASVVRWLRTQWRWWSTWSRSGLVNRWCELQRSRGVHLWTFA